MNMLHCYIYRHDFDSYNNITITIPITKWSGIQNTKYIIKTEKKERNDWNSDANWNIVPKHKIQNKKLTISIFAIGWFHLNRMMHLHWNGDEKREEEEEKKHWWWKRKCKLFLKYWYWWTSRALHIWRIHREGEGKDLRSRQTGRERTTRIIQRDRFERE